MARTGGGGYGSKGGDNNEERLRKMVADHLRASELFAIDTRTPQGLASLTAILGQALQADQIAGEAQREEEARKAAEAKATEKKRKRDERATTGALSPRTLETKSYTLNLCKPLANPLPSHLHSLLKPRP
jgi:hypothetical protein